MLRFVRRALLWLVLALAPAAPSAAPLAAYTRLPAIEVTTVSPSGGRLAVVVTNGEQRSVIVRDLRSGSNIARAVFGDTPILAVRWAGEDHVLITTQVQYDSPRVLGGLREWRRLHVFDVGKQQIRTMLDDAPDGMSNILRSPIVRTIDGRPTVFVEGIQFIGQRGYVALYQVNLETGHGRVVQPATTGNARWIVGADGRAVGRLVIREQPRRSSIEVRIGDSWREVFAADDPGEGTTLVGLGRDGRSVLYTERQAGGPSVWREQPLDGGPAQALSFPPHHTVAMDPQTGRLIGHAGWDGDTYNVVYFDPVDDQVAQAMRQAYPAAYVGIDSWSDDLRVVVGLIDSSNQLPAYALFDRGAGRAGWVGPEYPELTEADVGPQVRVRFKAADGLDLVGYLTRPPGRAQAKGLPLVVVPHDDGRATPGFDWRVQALASRGYAVLQVNFRGSTGLGETLRKAGEGQIGRGMQTDLSDAVRLLADAGAIDPKRVCIVGQGYGGYAALAGVSLQPDTYRCAVAIGGHFELVWPKSPLRPMPEDVVANLKRNLGVDGPDDPRLRQYSPVAQAASVRAPVLLIYGRNDTSTAGQDSEAMAAALRKAGKSVELLVLSDGDRLLKRAAARAQAFNAVVTFLETHNPPN